MVKSELEKYSESLVNALKEYMEFGKEEPFNKHCESYGIKIPTHPITYKATIMKVVTGRVDLPMEYRTTAKKWLKENYMESWDDGDVPC